MSSVDDLKKQKGELQVKLNQTQDMIGKGMSWKDAQFYLEKYKEEMRVIDVRLARMQLGEDALSELRKKKGELQAKLASLGQMKNSGEISDKVYKDKKKELDKEMEQVEKDIVDAM